ncbi:hypothetical protein F5884DRAFT_494117 [Xylogone sp. PMI_703]|nr:hypothetical protein F5884DRAFT_494117 [Xylogone sp. PMI_703]
MLSIIRDSEFLDYGQLDPLIRQFIQLSPEVDPRFSRIGDYYPIFYDNSLSHMTGYMAEFNSSVKHIKLKVEINTRSYGSVIAAVHGFNRDHKHSARGLTLPANSEIERALASIPGTNYFWTGRVGQCRPGELDSTRGIAETVALTRSGATIENKLQVAGIAMPFYPESPYSEAEWDYASAQYGLQTSDECWIVYGTCIRPRNSWHSFEFPMLTTSGRMRCIWALPWPDLLRPNLLWSEIGYEEECYARRKRYIKKWKLQLDLDQDQDRIFNILFQY